MALLDKWIALDMGAYLARFYDFSTQKQIVLKTIIAKKGKETLGVSDQALAYYIRIWIRYKFNILYHMVKFFIQLNLWFRRG